MDTFTNLNSGFNHSLIAVNDTSTNDIICVFVVLYVEELQSCEYKLQWLAHKFKITNKARCIILSMKYESIVQVLFTGSLQEGHH